jgi:hypothetical protein
MMPVTYLLMTVHLTNNVSNLFFCVFNEQEIDEVQKNQ